MDYADVLTKLISGSGKTLRDIADSCKDLGVNFDPSYLSRLQTGRQAPPSDAINRAIAQVLGVNPDDLLLAAYKEKSPSFIKTFIANIAKRQRKFTKAVLLAKYPKTLSEEKIAALEKLDDWVFVNNVINDPEFSVESIFEQCNQKDGRTTFSFTIPDNSLKDIPVGTEVMVSRVQKADDISAGDYVLIALPDTTHQVRKVMHHDGKTILLADNLLFDSYTLSESIEIVGKVDSIMLPPKK